MKTKIILSSKFKNMDDSTITYHLGSKMKSDIPIIKDAINRFHKIKEYRNYKINLFCMGSSGAIMSTLFQVNSNRDSKIVHLKKDGEESHNGSGISKRHYKMTTGDDIRPVVNIIIDDFIATGSTIRTIISRMEKCDISTDVLIITGGFNQTLFKNQFKHIIANY